MTGDSFSQNYAEILCLLYMGFFENILQPQEQGKQILMTMTENFFFGIESSYMVSK